MFYKYENRKRIINFVKLNWKNIFEVLKTYDL